MLKGQLFIDYRTAGISLDNPMIGYSTIDKLSDVMNKAFDLYIVNVLAHYENINVDISNANVYLGLTRSNGISIIADIDYSSKSDLDVAFKHLEKVFRKFGEGLLFEGPDNQVFSIMEFNHIRIVEGEEEDVRMHAGDVLHLSTLKPFPINDLDCGIIEKEEARIFPLIDNEDEDDE